MVKPPRLAGLARRPRRLKEASSWGGIAALLAAIISQIPSPTWQAIIAVIAGGAGVAAVAIPEKAK